MRTARSVPALTQILLDRIRQHGSITFAEFMQACLYHPEHGYYTHTVAAGADDYYTSPHVHPIFGRLLARQFRQMWEILGRPSTFDLVEFGAGDGTLAVHALAWIEENSPDFARALRVVLLESSAYLRQRGAEQLKQRVWVPVRWAAEPGAGSFSGCLYSNEFVDAFPVHRLVQRERGLREIYVTARGDELATEEGELSTPELADYLARYGAALARGQQAEINLAALGWLEEVTRVLAQGFLLTIDYGYLARELYSSTHPSGTLLAYREHRVSEDVLAWPGTQDLTAHVNFTALMEHGRSLGLNPLGLTTQTKFLLALGKENEFADLYASEASESERYQARLRLKQLIYPEGMGETFKVLVQSKGVKKASLTGLRDL